MQKHEEQLAEPLSQVTNCVSGSKADLSVDVLNSESGGIRSFFPSVLDNWVRYYIDSMGDPCIKNSHSTLSSYLEHKALPFMSDFMMQAHIASILIMLMRSNRDFFSQFDVKIDCPVLNPKWHFLSQLGVVSDHTTFFTERFYMNERIPMQLTFYRMIDSTYTFSYKGLHMFTSKVNEPDSMCSVMKKNIPRVNIEGFGKHGCWYFLGDLYALLYKDLFAHILEVAWHPDRCFKWCFAYDNHAINYEKYEKEAKTKFYEIEVLNRKISELKMI